MMITSDYEERTDIEEVVVRGCQCPIHDADAPCLQSWKVMVHWENHEIRRICEGCWMALPHDNSTVLEYREEVEK